jgi:ubiquinone/menaquinone biosynthesis C-methylase UbiE
VSTDHDRVRQSYDAVAEEYTTRLAGELEYKPLDRALLSALLEQTETGAPVADVGCGPGHVTGWLADQGARVVGMDISTRMISVARSRYRKAEFREGDLLSLPASDCEFGSAVALYSIIHLDPSETHLAFAELRRVLRPSGLLLVSFHVGRGVRHFEEWWGKDVDLDFRFREVDDVAEALAGCGLEEEARLERRNYPQEIETRRAYLLARRLS